MNWFLMSLFFSSLLILFSILNYYTWRKIFMTSNPMKCKW